MHKLSDIKIQIIAQIVLFTCQGYITLMSNLAGDPKFKMLALFSAPLLQGVAAVCALYINPNGTPAGSPYTPPSKPNNSNEGDK